MARPVCGKTSRKSILELELREVNQKIESHTNMGRPFYTDQLLKWIYEQELNSIKVKTNKAKRKHPKTGSLLYFIH